jgi:hypothetical protein
MERHPAVTFGHPFWILFALGVLILIILIINLAFTSGQLCR